jgi:hypothetical protein
MDAKRRSAVGFEAGKGERQEFGLGYQVRGLDNGHVIKVGLISNSLLHQLLEACY